MGCHSLLQEIFLIQRYNPGLLHRRQILYHLCHHEGHTVPSQPKLHNLFNKDLWELMTWQKQFNKGCRDRYLLPLSSGNSLLIWKKKLISSVAQSCPTLCDPIDCHTPGLSVHHQLPKFIEGTIISVIRAKIKIHTKYDEEGVTERSESFQRKWDILT